jgi:hypothetical protein
MSSVDVAPAGRPGVLDRPSQHHAIAEHAAADIGLDVVRGHVRQKKRVLGIVVKPGAAKRVEGIEQPVEPEFRHHGV